MVDRVELKLDGKHWGMCYGDSELLNSFCSNVQDGCYGGHLKYPSNHLFSQTLNQIELKLDGRHRYVPVSIMPFMVAILIIHIFSQTVSLIERKLDGKHCCMPISNLAAMGAILIFFKPPLLPNIKSD